MKPPLSLRSRGRLLQEASLSPLLNIANVDARQPENTNWRPALTKKMRCPILRSVGIREFIDSNPNQSVWALVPKTFHRQDVRTFKRFICLLRPSWLALNDSALSLALCQPAEGRVAAATGAHEQARACVKQRLARVKPGPHSLKRGPRLAARRAPHVPSSKSESAPEPINVPVEALGASESVVCRTRQKQSCGLLGVQRPGTHPQT